MTYKSPYGVPEGLERRLAQWANQLSRDKTYPWVGSGLIDDLKLASTTLGAPPFETLYPMFVGGKIPPPPGAPKPPAPPMEFDL